MTRQFKEKVKKTKILNLSQNSKILLVSSFGTVMCSKLTLEQLSFLFDEATNVDETLEISHPRLTQVKPKI